MIHKVLFLLSFILISQYAYSQDSIKYFNEKYQLISEKQFKEELDFAVNLSVQGDSIHHKILVLRTKKGKVENVKQLFDFLNSKSKIQINKNAPILLVYYPGKDACNSSSDRFENRMRKWYADLAYNAHKFIKSKPIYVGKSSAGLDTNNFVNWMEDSNQMIEKTFFKYHYPCYSFVVIEPSGNFESYFGEFSIEKVIQVLRRFRKS